MTQFKRYRIKRGRHRKETRKRSIEEQHLKNQCAKTGAMQRDGCEEIDILHTRLPLPAVETWWVMGKGLRDMALIETEDKAMKTARKEFKMKLELQETTELLKLANKIYQMIEIVM